MSIGTGVVALVTVNGHPLFYPGQTIRINATTTVTLVVAN